MTGVRAKGGVKKFLMQRMTQILKVVQKDYQTGDRTTTILPQPLGTKPQPRRSPIVATEDVTEPAEVVNTAMDQNHAPTTTTNYVSRPKTQATNGRLRRLLHLGIAALATTTTQSLKLSGYRTTDMTKASGFDLMTHRGRSDAELQIKLIQPDVIIGKWEKNALPSMLRQIPTYDNIKRQRREHANMVNWVDRMQTWQTVQNQGQWLDGCTIDDTTSTNYLERLGSLFDDGQSATVTCDRDTCQSPPRTVDATTDDVQTPQSLVMCNSVLENHGTKQDTLRGDTQLFENGPIETFPTSATMLPLDPIRIRKTIDKASLGQVYHPTKTLECPYCHKGYSSKLSLKTHKKSIHPQQWNTEQMLDLVGRKLSADTIQTPATASGPKRFHGEISGSPLVSPNTKKRVTLENAPAVATETEQQP